MDLFHQLDRDWATLAHSRTARTQLAAWTRTNPIFAGMSDLGALIEQVHDRTDLARSDHLLAALARRAATDTLSARTLLQALLPGLRSAARRYQRTAEAFGDDAASVVVAFAWERIRSYPYDRRPRRIAANVVLDTRQHLQRRFDRPRLMVVSLDEHPRDLASDICDSEPPVGLLDEAVSQRVITAHDAALIGLTRLGGVSVAEVAARLDVVPQSLRRRRRRAELRLGAFV